MANKERQELDVVLDGVTYVVRPTLEKVAEIESNYGSVLSLMRKIRDNDMPATTMAGIVGIMLDGAKGAPPRATIQQIAFNAGIYVGFTAAVNMFLINAVRADNPTTEGEKAGN